VINDRIDDLTRQAQMIAYNKLIDDKLAALREAGSNLKLSVNEKVDNLLIQATDRRPNTNDPNYEEKILLYNNWLDQITEGIKNVHSFFDRLWSKVTELLDKIFTWIRDGVANLAEKISNAFKIIKATFANKNMK